MLSCSVCVDGQRTTLQNHPQVVDVGKLPDYPRRACGNTFPIRPECIDDPANLFAARVFIFRGTHDRCYLPVNNMQPPHYFCLASETEYNAHSLQNSDRA